VQVTSFAVTNFCQGIMTREQSRLTIIVLAAACALLVAADCARAQIINGGFESGSAGWTLTYSNPIDGNTSITFPTSGTPAQGAEYAHLDCLVIGPQPPPIFVDQGNCALSQTFTASAGQWVSFDYRDDGYVNGGGLYDNDFFIVSCGTNHLQDYIGIPEFGQSIGNGWYTYSFPPFTSAGTYTFTAEAYAEAQGQPGGQTMSEEDPDIDAVTLNSVPEPSTFALLGAAAIGRLGWALRKGKSRYGRNAVLRPSSTS
jgi:hypothetical protein